MISETQTSTRTVCGLILLAALWVGCSFPATAQNNNDGSIYSRFGLGDLRSFSSSRIQAMGGLSPGMRSFNALNFNNPASWSEQVLTRVNAGMIYQNLTITDASNNTSRLASGFLNAIQFSFPILSGELGVGFGLQPFSRVRYRVREEGTIAPDPTLSDSTAFQIDNKGGGGLQEVTGGLGYKLNDHVRIGVNVRYIFGVIEYGRRTTFSSDAFEETNLTTSTRLTGWSGTAGILFSANDVLREEDDLAIGAAFTLPSSLNAERVRTLGETLDRDTLGTEITGTTDLPFRATLGAVYHPDDRWILSIGGKYEPWSQFESDVSFPGYTPGEQSLFSDRVRAAAGFEFLPAGSDLVASYLMRTAYRLGVYYDRAYVTPLPDVDIRTVAVTGGFSFPTMLAGTHLDINFEVGTRGTTDHGLVRDRFYKIALNVNIGERWFQKRKLD